MSERAYNRDMINQTSPRKKATPRKTFYGLASLIAAIISVMFLGAFFGISQLNISPATFSVLNNLLGMIMCVIAPIAMALGAFAFTRKNDSRILSGIGMGIVGIPFLVLFGQFVSAVFLVD